MTRMVISLPVYTSCRAMSGSTSATNQGILEMSQGQEHATAIVFEVRSTLL